ncbi:hypothetical protein, partial [Campylobacter sp.]|uniref:hypothetical protein n=1 Tax=Campylobacter sp. TaxID=205 RepID=UPI002AA82FA0
MRFSQLRNSRIPSKNLEFLSKILEFPRNFRIPKPCIILRLVPMISVLGNSKIPYRDPQLKLEDDTEHARR